MKRSELNNALLDAKDHLMRINWVLPEWVFWNQMKASFNV